MKTLSISDVIQVEKNKILYRFSNMDNYDFDKDNNAYRMLNLYMYFVGYLESSYQIGGEVNINNAIAQTARARDFELDSQSDILSFIKCNRDKFFDNVSYGETLEETARKTNVEMLTEELTVHLNTAIYLAVLYYLKDDRQIQVNDTTRRKATIEKIDIETLDKIRQYIDKEGQFASDFKEVIQQVETLLN